MSKAIFRFCMVIFLMINLVENANSQETTKSPASFDFNDKGLVFQTADGANRVMMRFRIQSSMTMFTESEDDFKIAASDISIRRMRLRFGGNLYDPRLSFNLQLSFARGDLDYDDTQFPNIIRDAMVFWKFSDNFQIGVGQTKLPGNRQRVISSGDLQFPDRSIVNSRFTLDRDFGLQTSYSNEIEGVAFNLRGAISSGDGRYAPRMDGANFAYTGRVELLPLGRFSAGGDYYEADLYREPSPKISIGATYSDNKKSTRSRGQLGTKLFAERDMQLLSADMILKYSGLSFYAEYAKRDARDPITTNSDGDVSYVYVGDGYLLQSGYLFDNNFEIAARLAQVNPLKNLAGLKGAEQNRHIAFNTSYYLQNHRAKIQFEITHNSLTNNMTDITKNNWIFRLNTELGI